MHTPVTQAAWADVEGWIARDLGGRGIGSLVVAGDLEQGSRRLYEASRVMIITGYPVPAARTGETDGPPGALAVARALERLGKAVTLVSDHYTQPLLAAGAGMWGIRAALVPFPMAEPGQGGMPAARAFAARVLDLGQPECLLAIERPGAAADGEYYNIRGRSITPWVAQADALFHLGEAAGLPRVAVGDGGNEMGMGKVLDRMPARAPHLVPVASSVSCDHLVTAGVSNWGAYGLVAGLSLLSKRNLLPTPGEEEGLLAALVAAGAVDGVTGRAEVTVDRLPVSALRECLEKLHRMVGQAIHPG